MKRYALALDLKDDPKLIAEYIEYHKEIWPEIATSLTESGITSMEIYHIGDRLFMIMEVNESFDFAKKAAADAASEVVQRWETLMWNYQKPLPWAKEGEKWMLMDKIFELKA